MRKIPNINTHIFKQPNIPWSLETVSDEAQDMLDNYSSLGVALSGIERSLMIDYVDSLVDGGHYALTDNNIIHSLGVTNEINGLLDWKYGKVGTNNGATFDVNGATFNGVDQYINSNFTPSTDYVNASINDVLMGGFNTSIDGTSDEEYLIGVSDLSYITSLFFRIATNSTTVALNSINIIFLPLLLLPK